MKKLVIAALLIAAGAVLAHMHVVAQTYYPVVHVTTPEGLKYTAVFDRTDERRACGAKNDRFVAPFKSMCKECNVVLARCERELDGLELALSEGQDVPFHRIYAPGLRVAISGPAEMARLGCDTIAQGLTAQGMRQVACVYPSKSS
ncbi:MAG: hypothetical protein ACT4P3_08025 [Betaproteobacteria bacterium]